jgi:hypothetical protein
MKKIILFIGLILLTPITASAQNADTKALIDAVKILSRQVAELSLRLEKLESNDIKKSENAPVADSKTAVKSRDLDPFANPEDGGRWIVEPYNNIPVFAQTEWRVTNHGGGKQYHVIRHKGRVIPQTVIWDGSQYPNKDKKEPVGSTFNFGDNK